MAYGLVHGVQRSVMRIFCVIVQTIRKRTHMDAYGVETGGLDLI